MQFPDIGQYIQEVSILLVPFLLAITCHEACHGLVAYLLGDPTAKNAGRLTLNPLKHLDPMGTVVLVLTRMIGWAKPVPVDSRYFKNPRRDVMLVSLAGPAANFILAILFAIAFRQVAFIIHSGVSEQSLIFWEPLFLICRAGIFINLVLGCFNLLPIPPLDGSGVMAWLLPQRAAMTYLSYGSWGMFAVLLLAVTGLLGYVLNPLVSFFLNIINRVLT